MKTIKTYNLLKEHKEYEAYWVRIRQVGLEVLDSTKTFLLKLSSSKYNRKTIYM